MLSNIDGTNEEVLATRRDGNKLSVYGLAWSPDGKQDCLSRKPLGAKVSNESGRIRCEKQTRTSDRRTGRGSQILQVDWRET